MFQVAFRPRLHAGTLEAPALEGSAGVADDTGRRHVEKPSKPPTLISSSQSMKSMQAREGSPSHFNRQWSSVDSQSVSIARNHFIVRRFLVRKFQMSNFKLEILLTPIARLRGQRKFV
jgi:hypothetical protein